MSERRVSALFKRHVVELEKARDAYGRVMKPGRTLTVTTGDVVAETNAVATMLATMMSAGAREISG